MNATKIIISSERNENNNYIISERNENNNYIISERNENTTVKNQCNLSDKVTFIDSSGKLISLNESTGLPLISNLCTNESHKDTLLTSLYSQIEFLRNELQVSAS